MTAWVVIRNWDNFQHYKDRNPPWIKNYTELLSDDSYLGLSGHRRSILHGLWLEYARSHCRLPLDTRLLTRRLNLRVTTKDIESLNDAGFIMVSDSTALSSRSESDSARARPRARTEAETEADRENPLTSSVSEVLPSSNEPSLPEDAGGDIDFATPNGEPERWNTDIDIHTLANVIEEGRRT